MGKYVARGGSFGEGAGFEIVEDVPDEVMREYRTYVETGFAAVMAKASVIALKGAGQDVTGLLTATASTVSAILKE